jgi:hypothetical protein
VGTGNHCTPPKRNSDPALALLGSMVELKEASMVEPREALNFWF